MDETTSRTTAVPDRAGAVELAQDVLLHLACGKLDTDVFGYVHVRWGSVPTPGFNEDVQPFLKADGTVCSVCALGALFVAEVIRHDNCRAGELGTEEARLKHLLPYFGQQGMRDIECAYELWGTDDNRAADFGRAYSHPTVRLQAIMQNVIDNGGVFVPSEVTA